MFLELHQLVETLKKNKKLIWKSPSDFNKDIIKKTHSSNYIDTIEKPFQRKD